MSHNNKKNGVLVKDKAEKKNSSITERNYRTSLIKNMCKACLGYPPPAEKKRRRVENTSRWNYTTQEKKEPVRHKLIATKPAKPKLKKKKNRT